MDATEGVRDGVAGVYTSIPFIVATSFAILESASPIGDTPLIAPTVVLTVSVLFDPDVLKFKTFVKS